MASPESSVPTAGERGAMQDPAAPLRHLCSGGLCGSATQSHGGPGCPLPTPGDPLPHRTVLPAQLQPQAQDGRTGGQWVGMGWDGMG